MDRLLHGFREYPAIAGIVLFIVVGVVVGGVIGTMMWRAGLSLKPLVFFFVFLAIVGIPQATVHVLDIVAFQRQAAQPAAGPGSDSGATPRPSPFKPVSWAAVFGPGADPSLIVDAKLGLGTLLSDAVEAKLSFNAGGESALAARFPSDEAAARAVGEYRRFFQFAEVTGGDATGWTARRHGGQGEWNHVVQAGAEVYAWTGSSRPAVVARREQVLGPLGDGGNTSAPGAGSSPGAVLPRRQRAHEARLVSGAIASRPVLWMPFVAINLLVATLWFFKGSAWASRIRPPAERPRLGISELHARLDSIGRPEFPVSVTRSDDGRSVSIEWRYADDRWADWARLHRSVRTHRLVLTLDPEAREVRVREYFGGWNASVGGGGARLDWKRAVGIQFFDFERRRVVGGQFDAAGAWTGEWSRGGTFDLQTLKAPVIQAVTDCGWTWQPVLWEAPPALRWLTQ